MYIIAIAWMYVAILIAVTEPTVIGKIMSLMFYGVLPLALLLWLFGTPVRRKRKLQRIAEEDRQSTEMKKGEGDTESDSSAPPT